MLKAKRKLVPIGMRIKMLEESQHESLSRAPDDVKARHRVPRLVQSALGPVKHREKGHAVVIQPASDHVERLTDVCFGPAKWPDIALVQFAVSDPISKRQIDTVFDACAFLLGGTDHEHSAKRYAREPAKFLFPRSLDKDDT